MNVAMNESCIATKDKEQVDISSDKETLIYDGKEFTFTFEFGDESVEQFFSSIINDKTNF